MVNESSFPGVKPSEYYPTYQLYKASRLSVRGFTLLLSTPSWHDKHATISCYYCCFHWYLHYYYYYYYYCEIFYYSVLDDGMAALYLLRVFKKRKLVSCPLWLVYQSTDFKALSKKAFFFNNFITNFHLKQRINRYINQQKHLKVQFMTNIKLLHVLARGCYQGVF